MNHTNNHNHNHNHNNGYFPQPAQPHRPQHTYPNQPRPNRGNTHHTHHTHHHHHNNGPLNSNPNPNQTHQRPPHPHPPTQHHDVPHHHHHHNPLHPPQTRTIAHYRRIKQIGEGTYGQVYRAQCLTTHRIVALKKIRLSSSSSTVATTTTTTNAAHQNKSVPTSSSEGLPRTVIREIKILKALRHSNMVRMLEVVTSKGYEHLDEEDEHRDDAKRRKDQEAMEREKERREKKRRAFMSKRGGGREKEREEDVGGGGGGNDGGGVGKEEPDVGNGEKDTAATTTDPPPTTKPNETINNNNNNTPSPNYNYSKGNLFLVLEYVPHDLSGILDMGYHFSEVQTKCIFRQLLSVLKYMHENRYVHRDLKSANILIDERFRVKLADFGLARRIDGAEYKFEYLHNNTKSDSNRPPNLTNKVVTLWYRPPELLLGSTVYDEKIDIWSAGCILAELLLGKAIFPGKNEFEQLRLIYETLGTPKGKSWKQAFDPFIERANNASGAYSVSSGNGNYNGSGNPGTKHKSSQKNKKKKTGGGPTSSGTSGSNTNTSGNTGPNILQKLLAAGLSEPDIDRPHLSKLHARYSSSADTTRRRSIKPQILEFLERLLSLEPEKRLRASQALESQYFRSQPVAPENPEELDMTLDVGGDSHEYETKMLRRKAKVEAQKASEDAKRKGRDEKEAYDAAYDKYLTVEAGRRADEKNRVEEDGPVGGMDFGFRHDMRGGGGNSNISNNQGENVQWNNGQSSTRKPDFGNGRRDQYRDNNEYHNRNFDGDQGRDDREHSWQNDRRDTNAYDERKNKEGQRRYDGSSDRSSNGRKRRADDDEGPTGTSNRRRRRDGIDFVEDEKKNDKQEYSMNEVNERSYEKKGFDRGEGPLGIDPSNRKDGVTDDAHQKYVKNSSISSRDKKRPEEGHDEHRRESKERSRRSNYRGSSRERSHDRVRSNDDDEGEEGRSRHQEGRSSSHWRGGKGDYEDKEKGYRRKNDRSSHSHDTTREKSPRIRKDDNEDDREESQAKRNDSKSATRGDSEKSRSSRHSHDTTRGKSPRIRRDDNNDDREESQAKRNDSKSPTRGDNEKSRSSRDIEGTGRDRHRHRHRHRSKERHRRSSRDKGRSHNRHRYDDKDEGDRHKKEFDDRLSRGKDQHHSDDDRNEAIDHLSPGRKDRCYEHDRGSGKEKDRSHRTANNEMPKGKLQLQPIDDGRNNNNEQNPKINGDVLVENKVANKPGNVPDPDPDHPDKEVNSPLHDKQGKTVGECDKGDNKSDKKRLIKEETRCSPSNEHSRDGFGKSRDSIKKNSEQKTPRDRSRSREKNSSSKRRRSSRDHRHRSRSPRRGHRGRSDDNKYRRDAKSYDMNRSDGGRYDTDNYSYYGDVNKNNGRDRGIQEESNGREMKFVENCYRKNRSNRSRSRSPSTKKSPSGNRRSESISRSKNQERYGWDKNDRKYGYDARPEDWDCRPNNNRWGSSGRNEQGQGDKWNKDFYPPTAHGHRDQDWDKPGSNMNKNNLEWQGNSQYFANQHDLNKRGKDWGRGERRGGRVGRHNDRRD